MKTFLLRRLLAIVPLVIAVTFITQTLLVLSPGDYFTTLAESPNIRPEYLAQLRAQYHLDSKNPFVRYGYWLKSAVRGDFGYSFKYQLPVWQLMFERFYNTLLLAFGGLILAWGLAIPLGMLAAVKKDTLYDRLSGAVSVFGLSIPSVFLSLLLLLLAAKTHWFPIGGNHDQIFWDYMTPWQKVVDAAWHLILPSMVVATIGLAQYMRQMRAEMIETLSQDYIRTARSKGLPERKVLFGHALGNAINPLITLFGFSLASLLSGAFITEFVFAWPGMGRLTVDALIQKDEPVVMASIVMITIMLVLGSLAADVILALVDPRIRLE